jgi:site-specific DNA-methyltransferase (adenine-specific)
MREGIKSMLSSKDMDWETPQEFFNELDKEFNFTLDPCATKQTAKCSKFYTKKDNGLNKDWNGEVVFCNSPYGKEIKNWVKKCSEEKALVVMLIPARTDTKYFHDYIYKKKNVEVRFIKGRLKFGGKQKGSGSAPFPSMIIIFRNGDRD